MTNTENTAENLQSINLPTREDIPAFSIKQLEQIETL